MQAEGNNRPLVTRNNTPPSYVPQALGSSVQPNLGPGAEYRRGNAAGNRSSVYIGPTQPAIQAPASRRSASAGAVTPQHEQGPTWELGMPLPPPPPGPPPSGSRSTSQHAPHGHNRNGSIEIGGISVPILSMPRRPPRRGTLTIMDPVPPTPAGWTEDAPSSSPPPPPPPLPETAMSEASYEPSDSGSGPFSLRTGATQASMLSGDSNSSGRGIRERRSASRAARDRIRAEASSPDATSAIEAKPADLVLTSPNSGISRQGAVKKLRNSASPQDVRQQPQRPGINRRVTGPEPTSTPPFSPGAEASNPMSRSLDGPLPPKALPTPPPQSGTERRLSGGKASGQEKRGSAIGKMRAVGLPTADDSSIDSFVRASLDRHQSFIEKERAAESDRERLELFAEYIVNESRLRRDRYTVAFTSMASDIFDLTRDLWRPIQPSTANSLADSDSGQPKPNRKESFDSYTASSPMSSRANFTPLTESDSPASNASQPAGRDNKLYQPVLSPILSMAMSTVPDEPESRGRSASRWWESDAGSSGASQRIERSKRESKFMGLRKEARFNLQYEDEPSPSLASLGTPGRAGPSSEYPPEKVGWHDEESLPTPQPSMPSTPLAPTGMDVSRLMTLPPPYPRHYPAESNSHPDLAELRTTLRKLGELDFVGEIKAAHKAKLTQKQAIAGQEAVEREAQMRHNIAEQVRLGQINYASAAAVEESFQTAEVKAKQDTLRAEFDNFAPEVMNPLHARLSERIAKAGACIADLKDGLTSSVSEASPEAPMEEGDERPELLEKLKLLKWLVEARETLHREAFALEHQRCELYRELIVSDLKARGESEAKIREAEQFFRIDQLDRRAKFEREARSRVEDFSTVVETHVSRGVEDQLSAFWDIAPGLLEVVKKVPVEETHLARFKVSVPIKEVEENSTYATHPLQYLYVLLGHAEKATYQFIENQVGLLCLLHEVGLGVMRAGLRVVEVDRCAAEGEDGASDEELQREMAELAEYEERRLTGELKDRVGVVEGQWKDALGGELSACSERVERVLEETGGWDENLRE
jgi:hypothetical protein